MKAADAIRFHEDNHSDDDDRLIRFLIARFSEDERAIRKVPADESTPAGAINDRARLRREVDGKREVLGVAQRLLVLRDMPLEEPVRVAARDVMQLLAVVYDEHPAYEENWRPRGKRRRPQSASARRSAPVSPA